ncbi:hypothetical protein Scep_014276 [Stephania cephalantha]|uniref:Uncharacterized protein n=1 Tax=Stephania cephalantha TaxID=152367 RepID=A0AAP0J294_9MAGN
MLFLLILCSAIGVQIETVEQLSPTVHAFYKLNNIGIHASAEQHFTRKQLDCDWRNSFT